jgi:hypothetical protein
MLGNNPTAKPLNTSISGLYKLISIWVAYGHIGLSRLSSSPTTHLQSHGAWHSGRSQATHPKGPRLSKHRNSQPPSPLPFSSRLTRNGLLPRNDVSNGNYKMTDQVKSKFQGTRLLNLGWKLTLESINAVAIADGLWAHKRSIQCLQ